MGAGARRGVLRIDQADDPYLVIFLADLVGHREHWTPKRTTVPCYGKLRKCNNCGRLPLRFYGYTAVLWQDPRTGRLDPWVLQATASVEEQLRGRDLRGEVHLLSARERQSLGRYSLRMLNVVILDPYPSPFKSDQFCSGCSAKGSSISAQATLTRAG